MRLSASGRGRTVSSPPRRAGSTPRGSSRPTPALRRRFPGSSGPLRRWVLSPSPACYPPKTTFHYISCTGDRSTRRKGKQQRGVDPASRGPDAEVEVGSRRPSARAYRADPLPANDLLPLGDITMLQMVIDAEQASPVVQHHRVPSEELLPRERHGPVRDRHDGRPRRKIHVHAGVGGAGLAVDDPAGAESLRPELRHRREKREPPRGGGGDPGKTLFQPSGFPVDPFQCLAVELRHRLRQRELLNRKGSLPDRNPRVAPEHFVSPHRPERKEGIDRRFLEIDPDQTQEIPPPFLPHRDLPPLPDHDDVVRPGRGARWTAGPGRSHPPRLPANPRFPGREEKE